jgi:hypothetical protein
MMMYSTGLAVKGEASFFSRQRMWRTYATASSFSNLISGFLLSLSRRDIQKAFLNRRWTKVGYRNPVGMPGHSIRAYDIIEKARCVILKERGDH